MGTRYWHTDSTYSEISAKCGMLTAVTVPSWGGQTEFADMAAAYDALEEQARARVEGLRVYHAQQYSAAQLGHWPGVSMTVGRGFDGEAVLRPLVKTHPVTGRKSLFVARHCFGIPGMGLEESEKFLDELVGFACQPPRVYTHDWKVGDFVIWDQRRMVHRGRPYDENEVRAVLGTRIQGDPVTERALETPEAKLGSEVLAAELARLKRKEER